MIIAWLFMTKRWAGIILGLILQVLLLTAGCAPASKASVPKGTEFVIFIDFSESIRNGNHRLFKKDLENHIIPTLSAGDRILIAPITDKTLTQFHPLVDVTFPSWPSFNGWSTNRLDYQNELKRINEKIPQLREEVTGSVSDIFSKNRASPHTDIFSSLILAEKLFHNIARNKVLVIMSDMIEDYPPYRFDRVAWSPDTTEELLKELDEKGLVPDLSGVCVYVSGTSAKTPDMAEQISSFWYAYFDQAGADMHPSRYAHVLLHWPPAKSCAQT